MRSLFFVTLLCALTPSCASAAVDQVRPPAPPSRPPYRIVAVTVAHGAASLAGTVTLPEGPGPFPAVVLISGDGTETGAAALFPALADHLTRKNIVVCRFDTPVSGSGAALAAVAHLAAIQTVDARRVGIGGYAGGAAWAVEAGVTSRDVAFVVLLAPKDAPGPVPVPAFTTPDPAARLADIATWILATARR
jgi:dienelactone hydrolase